MAACFGHTWRMKQSSRACRVRGVAWKLALVAGFTPGAVWAQEDCEENADCGHGFQCIHTSANTSSVVTGSGGSTAVECGDGICEGGVEDPDSCPQDCHTIQYCAPAECDSNADCAAGYECGEEVGANSSFTGAGGTTASVCGDDTCDIDENSDSCAEDCAPTRYCQVEQMQCTSDDDCAEGFYCYLEGSENSASAVSVSSVDSGTDTATDGSSGGSSDSGSGGTDSGFAPPADTGSATSGGDETGVCVTESSDNGGSSGTSGSSNNTASGPTDSSATGADTASSAANGAGGAGTTLGEGSPATGSDGDGDSSGSGNNATASDGGGAGGSDPGGDGGGNDGDDGGCSYAVVGVPPASGLLTVLLFGAVAATRRRRTGRA